jgi:hypothetical protein
MDEDGEILVPLFALVWTLCAFDSDGLQVQGTSLIFVGLHELYSRQP